MSLNVNLDHPHDVAGVTPIPAPLSDHLERSHRRFLRDRQDNHPEWF
jgi:hypothetical protein